MEKKDLLGVRTKPSPAKRRRKASAAGGGGLAKAIAAYLVSDSYMYALLASDPQQQQPSKAPATASPEKEATLVQKYKGSW